MADDVFGVEVVTPEQALVAGGATAVVLATSEGDLTVLDGHTPLVGDVVPGLVKVDLPDGTQLRLAVHGGFVQVVYHDGGACGGELLRHCPADAASGAGHYCCFALKRESHLLLPYLQ